MSPGKTAGAQKTFPLLRYRYYNQTNKRRPSGAVRYDFFANGNSKSGIHESLPPRLPRWSIQGANKTMSAIRAQGMSIFEMKKNEARRCESDYPAADARLGHKRKRRRQPSKRGHAIRLGASRMRPALWSSKPLGGKNAADARFAPPRNLRCEDAQRMI